MGKGITNLTEKRLAEIKEDPIYVVWKENEYDSGIWEWGNNVNS